MSQVTSQLNINYLTAHIIELKVGYEFKGGSRILKWGVNFCNNVREIKYYFNIWRIRKKRERRGLRKRGVKIHPFHPPWIRAWNCSVWWNHPLPRSLSLNSTYLCSQSVAILCRKKMAAVHSTTISCEPRSLSRGTRIALFCHICP